ncbi:MULTISPECIES: hypothetical protein [Kordiimonas]|jgi:hypothetical protein|uniref:hypothetical protein n=1 Tax=Kordiimonas TaxID=288021 RepID=UPI00257DFD04|nr:hypothetical protein [Kordiimonas sp. UBA4487]
MAKTAQMNEQIAAFSFMGLMASEGKIPGVVSGSANKQFFLVATEEAANELASDLTATGDFFALMTEAGMMRPVEPKQKKPFRIKITRPSGLGGGFGGMSGGALGGGAFAH